MKSDQLHTTGGIEASTYKELTLKDLEELFAELEKTKPLPFTIPFHLNEHTIPFWHQEGMLQAILDTTETWLNAAGYDMLVELGYLKLKPNESTPDKS